ncbi:nitroreductase family protein [soil metagenome]
MSRTKSVAAYAPRRGDTAEMPTDDPPLIRYAHPYPAPELAADHQFVTLDYTRRPVEAMRAAGAAFYADMSRRRSVRMIAPDPVPLDLIDTAIATASTAPSGAHCQPWKFVVIGDPAIKRRIRESAEEEERVNYLENRMNEEWQEAIAPLGTDYHKEFLEIAPWIVVLFEERYRVDAAGERRHNYYVKESVGIAAGMFITALHQAGLATLTHTPTPMAFLTKILGRPANERPFILFPIGYPADDVQVPDLTRKPLDEVRVVVGDGTEP